MKRRTILTGTGAALGAASLIGSLGGASAAAAERTKSGRVTVNGSDLFYTSIGEGTPVIFVHGGLGFDHQYFRPYLDPLATSMNVIFFDLLGHGRSERSAAIQDITLNRLSDDCIGLADALGLGKFVLIGHSFGGFIALNAAFRHPGRLSALGLVCTAADLTSGARNPLGGTEAQRAALKAIFAGAAANGSDTAFRKNWVGAVPLYYNNASPPPGALADMDVRTIYSAAAFNQGRGLLSRDAASPLYYNFTPKLGELHLPVYVGYGRGDIWRFGDNERIAANIPGARLRYFEHSGHWPFQEETEAFLGDIRSFVPKI